MKYKVHYTTSDGRKLTSDGGVFSCRSNKAEVSRVVRARENNKIKYYEISLVSDTQCEYEKCAGP